MSGDSLSLLCIAEVCLHMYKQTRTGNYPNICIGHHILDRVCSHQQITALMSLRLFAATSDGALINALIIIPPSIILSFYCTHSLPHISSIDYGQVRFKVKFLGLGLYYSALTKEQIVHWRRIWTSLKDFTPFGDDNCYNRNDKHHYIDCNGWQIGNCCIQRCCDHRSP